MIPSSFEYVAACSLEQALEHLRRPDAVVLAGGMSLIPTLKLRLATPSVLIDIARLAELRGLSSASGRLHIGALTTHAALLGAPELTEFPVFAEVARVIGDPQVHNRGTFGGSLAQAHPAADWPAVLLALQGEVVLRGPAGVRTVPGAEFFSGPFTTAVGLGELLTAVTLPRSAWCSGTAYSSTRQQASGMALAGVAVSANLDRTGRIEGVSIGVTGVNVIPFRAYSLEARLRGSAPQPEALEALCAQIAEADPMTDTHAAADYRRHLLTVNAVRALTSALRRAFQKVETST